MDKLIGNLNKLLSEVEEAKYRYSVKYDVGLVAAGKFRSTEELKTVFSTGKIEAIGENRVQEFREKYTPDMIVADAGYRTPAIAHELLEDGIEPLFPYKRPMTKQGFFKKYEYVYDEYYDCYICPGNQILSYSTTNRDGYKEYKSCGQICKKCPYLKQCTDSKDHVKVVTRHVWEEYLEKAEDIRHTLGNKQIYELRKETIERIFGTAKEQHGFRYTQYIGKARMKMKAGLTFAAMNLKKLAKILADREARNKTLQRYLKNIEKNFIKIEKWCWRSSPAPTLSTV